MRVVIVVALATTGVLAPAPAVSQAAVRAVLFFSPTCPHCHQVINQDLPAIFEQFGGPARVWVDQSVPQDDRVFYFVTNGQIEVLLIDASRPIGGTLYDRASQQFLVPRERMGVPRLIIGNTLLVGSMEIPTQFPELIAQAVATGGRDWPAIDGLLDHISSIPVPESTDVPEDEPAAPAAAALREQGDTAQAAANRPPPPSAPPQEDAVSPTAPPEVQDPVAIEAAEPAPFVESTLVESTLDDIPAEDRGVWKRFTRDPVGNGLAVVVFLAMLVSVYLVFARAPTWRGRESPSALVPMLAAVGLVVAGYLSYIEASGAVAVCGPVGDCNAVQQSAYARVLSIPVGIIGLAGYVAIALAWLIGHGTSRIATWGVASQFLMVFAGVLVSAYLTFLEPFVIGATCLWCLSSAVLMTTMLWLVAGPGFRALAELRKQG
jgi:uncharacterized membrane protein